jgi:hypothetical protein
MFAAAAWTLTSMVAMADAQDDAMATKCPNAHAWNSRMEKAHPEPATEAGARRDAGRTFTAPAYREELHRHFLADQAARDAWTAKGMKPEGWTRVKNVDADNQAWFKPRFTRQGYPTVAQVGERGVVEAFYLVWHATENTSDITFPVSMLPALTELTKQNVLPKADAAILIDEILRFEGKPQRYGTQYSLPADQSGPRLEPTEDLSHLDERRAAMDLMPSADMTCAMSVVGEGLKYSL